MLDEIEDVLIRADLGVDAAARIADAVGEGRYDKAISPDEVKAILAAEVEKVLAPVAQPLPSTAREALRRSWWSASTAPGKTTTIGKLAAKFRAEGRKVMLAAGDTFRAAAIEQLKIWGERTGAPVIARARAPMPPGLAFDALPRRGGEEHRRAAGRHRRAAAEQGRADGRAREDRARDEEGRRRRAARGAAGARRHRRPERAVAGRGVPQDAGRHRASS